MLDELDAHQQPAVGAAAMPSRRGLVILRRDQVLADRREIIVDDLAFGAETGLVPRRAELAAAADVRQREDSAFLQPQLSPGRGVVRRLTDLESTISVEQRRVAPVELHVATVHEKVRNLRPVARHGLALLRDQVRCVELRRLAHDLTRGSLARIHDPQGGRGEEAGHGDQCLVVAVARHRRCRWLNCRAARVPSASTRL